MKFNTAKALIDNQVVVHAVNSKAIVNKAIKLFDLSPVSADILGKSLTAVALLKSSRLKNKGDYLSATINGGGQAGVVTVCCNSNGDLKGTISNPAVPNIYTAENKLDSATAVGKDGKITVVKSLFNCQPYSSSSKIVSGDIATDFAYYLFTSEQQPSALTLGVSFDREKCRSAGGVLVEVLPNCDKKLLFDIETVLYAMDEMSYQFLDKSPREVVEKFFQTFKNFQILEEGVVRYKCDCSLSKTSRAVLSLGKADALSLIEQEGKIEVTCHFCNKKYLFDKEQVEEIFFKNKK